MIRIGVIADDLTGATDIASFLVSNGLSTIQMNGIPDAPLEGAPRAVVIGLKTRACPANEAITQSLEALNWLRQQGCHQVYFKYCSTFDSTASGNIGPVTDALMAALDTPFTVFSPALPVNGRTVYQGYLFVGDQLLAESGMRHHPVNPMTDSYLPRLVEQQSAGRCAVISSHILDQGVDATAQALARCREQGYRYAVLDALTEQHLLTQGALLREMPLVTGGSGLAIGLARQWAGQQHANPTTAGYPVSGPAVVLSGSCSVMTNRQVAAYQALAPAQQLDVSRCLTPEDTAEHAGQLAAWVSRQRGPLAPMVFATTGPAELAAIQQQYGAAKASAAVESLFAALARLLARQGVRRFIVAGGETAGAVTQSLNINGFHIGPSISPGVPWVTALSQPVSLALKSGNFGDESFFSRAQQEFPV